jgi:uncharacterized protein (DUF1501 family)
MRTKDNPYLQSRRDFIRQAACAAVGTAAMTATIRDLRFMNAAMAQTNVNDYKALVCIFLAGGNDSNNLIVPTIQTEWNNYAAIRTSLLALPLTGAPANQLVIPLSNLTSDNHTYGMHPACTHLASLFNSGKLAVLFNTGTLVFPITSRAQYQSSIAKPPQLFSHADQVTQWQTSIPDQPPLTGWGGRCADLMNVVNTNAPVSLSVTLAGANTFEVGNVVSEYSVSTSGAISLSGLAPTTNNASRYAAMTNILGLQYSNLQARAYSTVAAHSLNTGAVLNNAITATVDPSGSQQFWTTPFPGSGVFQVVNPTSGTTFNSGLGPQLKMIARLIEAGSRSTGFNMKRQIFFCSVGGYDLHTNQAPSGSPTTGSHSNLLAELDQCMNAFYAAMVQIGGPTLRNDPNFAQRVTAFTASDFSRTFPSNGQGSDHGWGSHHLIMGGSVQGQKTYGTFPALALNGPDDTGTGRWIPSTAIDQYYATLATWFGLDSSNLATVFPNLHRFSSPNLLFMG